MSYELRQTRESPSAALCAALALASAVLVAGCESAPTPPPPAPVQPAPPPTPSTPEPPPAPPPPVQRSEVEIRQMLDNIRNLLDQGQEEAAVAELQKILSSDRTNKVALSLMRQIRDDPVELYGRESFAYRVQQGDTLATIAQRYLADRDQFYGLARYNSIKVPRQLPYGLTMRIPGKQRAPAGSTPPAAPPPPAPAPTAEPAQAAPHPAPAPAAPDPATVERENKTAIDRAIRRARAAMARQDVCGAIAGWDEVLRIDPTHRTAALERDKALDLKKRLPSSKC